MDKFDGSAAAWQLLQSNGFVVADPSFPHIYDIYISSPLPVFITPDSAWQTFQVLFDNGLAQSETAQRRQLAQFSRRLGSAAREQAQIDGQDFSVLASYADLGLALQDEDFAATLPDGKRKIIDTLLSGVGNVEPGLVFPCGRVPSGARTMNRIRPNPPAISPPAWYATVVFRLSNPRETRLALDLTWLIHRDPELSKTWSALAAFDDALGRTGG